MFVYSRYLLYENNSIHFSAHCKYNNEKKNEKPPNFLDSDETLYLLYYTRKKTISCNAHK